MAETSPEYAGDLSVEAAWDLLKKDAKAQLVDVRTGAERQFVGLPDLSAVGRRLLCIDWQIFPNMDLNTKFVDSLTQELQTIGADRDTPLLFLCRSGARSRAAAVAMTEAGFTRAFNVAGGFEGDLDHEGRRGRKNGWKASGLPWRQT